MQHSRTKSYAIRTGPVAQSVTCLTADKCMTADPGVASSITAWFLTFMEIDREIIWERSDSRGQEALSTCSKIT